MRRKKTTRTVELTVERTDSFVVPKPGGQTFLWCEGCGRSVAFVTPEEASRASGVSQRMLFRRIEAGEIHSTETTDGSFLVCLASLR